MSLLKVLTPTSYETIESDTGSLFRCGFAILLLLLVSKVDLGKQLRLVMSVVAAGSGVAGLLLLTWARQEQIVLHKPGRTCQDLLSSKRCYSC
jgi:hypothetical protein